LVSEFVHDGEDEKMSPSILMPWSLTRAADAEEVEATIQHKRVAICSQSLRILLSSVFACETPVYGANINPNAIKGGGN
jgi:hypothetical protein